MSLAAYNLRGRQQVERTLTRKRPVIAGPDAFVPSGDSEQLNYTGPWEEMLSRFNAIDGTLRRRVEGHLRQVADGEFAELSVTYTNYIPAKEANNGDPDGVMPGGSRDNPSYSRNFSEATESILLHPKFQGISDEAALAATMLMTGYSATDQFTESETIGEVVQNASAELYAQISKGVTDYLVQRVTLTARYKSDIVPTQQAMTIATPPGPLAGVASGYNWLYMGATQEYTNGELWVTESYKLSGPGGWDKTLY